MQEIVGEVIEVPSVGVGIILSYFVDEHGREAALVLFECGTNDTFEEILYLG